MNGSILSLLLASLISFLPGCGSGKQDSTADTDTDADTDADADTDTDTDADTDIANEWGFSMRIPQYHTLDCGKYLDSDWLCTWNWDGQEGMVYVRSTPVVCINMGLSTNPGYESTGQISIDGVVGTLGAPLYDWGSNHHNDFIDFDWNNQHFNYNHSSLGWGYRACQSMDCFTVTSTNGTVVEDGCTCDRTLPTACVLVQADGTWAPLKDSFAVCDGDATCGD